MKKGKLIKMRAIQKFFKSLFWATDKISFDALFWSSDKKYSWWMKANCIQQKLIIWLEMTLSVFFMQHFIILISQIAINEPTTICNLLLCISFITLRVSRTMPRLIIRFKILS
jgi:hypothetical protein